MRAVSNVMEFPTEFERGAADINASFRPATYVDRGVEIGVSTGGRALRGQAGATPAATFSKGLRRMLHSRSDRASK